MKIFFLSLGFTTVLFFAWVGISEAYSLRDACGGVAWYAKHPARVGETCALLHSVPLPVWSGWTWRLGGRTLYISHDLPTLTIVLLWVVAGAGYMFRHRTFLLFCRRKIAGVE